MNDPARFRLNRAEAVILFIDVQERLSAVMEPAAFAAVQENLRRWIEGARILRGADRLDRAIRPRGSVRPSAPLALAECLRRG